MNADTQTANDRLSNDKPAYPPDWTPLRLDMMCHAREAIDWNAEAFDADEPIEGAEAVAFLAEWRGRMREALDAYDAAVGGRDG